MIVEVFVMSKKRTVLYQEVLDLLFQYDFYEGNSFYISDDIDTLLIDLYQHIIGDIKAIDERIESSLVDYSLSRLNSLDRAIIRYATYHLIKKDLPGELVIAEAVRLTKFYDDSEVQKQHKFTNKVLDAIFKS